MDFLGENLGLKAWAGILVTLLGIAIVVSEPKAKAKNEGEDEATASEQKSSVNANT